MPFTFSHPAAVLPLTYLPKRWFSLTALVIGSLTPDFEYFFRTRIYSSFSHTWFGLFWFDLPLTIILAFIFHLIVRNSLIDNLPNFVSQRFSVFKNFNWTNYFVKNFLTVTISAIIGIATHILWDGFTHEQGQFVQANPVLQNNLSLSKYSIPIYKLLQHLSTLMGGLIILFAIFRLPRDRNFQNSNIIFRFWFYLGLVAFSFIFIRLLINPDYKLYGNLIATAISGVLLGLILASLITRKYNSK